MCEGGERGGFACPYSTDVICSDCGTVWKPEDTKVFGRCPNCDGQKVKIERCTSCPVWELEYVRTHSHAGRLFERVLELEFDATNFSIPWHEVTAEEVKGLQILKDERERYNRESIKRDNGFPT